MVLSEGFDPSERPNPHLALDAYLAASGCRHATLGILGEQKRVAGLGRSDLLHGPRGAGKTLTAMCIAGQLHDRTVIMLTGRGFGLIQRLVEPARLPQPSIVLFEDVDLVAVALRAAE